jgi:hypothetical protein
VAEPPESTFFYVMLLGSLKSRTVDLGSLHNPLQQVDLGLVGGAQASSHSSSGGRYDPIKKSAYIRRPDQQFARSCVLLHAYTW